MEPLLTLTLAIALVFSGSVRSELHSLSPSPSPSPSPKLTMQDGNLHHSPQVRLRSPPEDHRGSRERRFPPGIREERLNVGKKVGILFAGVVAVLQIAVAGILVYNRVQMSRMRRSGEAVLAEPRSSCEVA